MNIKGKFVTLRAIEEEDLELLREMMNDCEMEKMVVGWAFPISKYGQKEWFASFYKSEDKKFIIETADNIAIGLATLGDFDWKNRSAFHGIKIAENKNRIKGLGTDAVMAIMRYAFDELQLNRLDGAIIDYNVASEGLYCNKCGWQLEGIRRQYVFKDGEYHDLKIVGILNEEYKNLIKKTNYWG